MLVQATSYPGSLVSMDCVLPESISGLSKAMLQTVLAVLAPFYIYIGAVIFWFLFNIFNYNYLTW